MYLSLLCFVLMLGLNLWLVPAIGIPNGYMGSAWAALGAYFIVMVISYFAGRHYYPLPYPLKTMFFYVCVTCVLYLLGEASGKYLPTWAMYIVRSILLIGYVVLVVKREKLRLRR